MFGCLDQPNIATLVQPMVYFWGRDCLLSDQMAGRGIVWEICLKANIFAKLYGAAIVVQK